MVSGCCCFGQTPSIFGGWTFCLDLNSIQSPWRVFTFWSAFVDIVLPVATTEGWNIQFELCDGGYQSYYILMTLCDDCHTANKGQYEWVFCKLLYVDFHLY